MVEIDIKEPIWKNRSVGIAADKIIDDLLVTISYKYKKGPNKGNKAFPGKFLMKRVIAERFPIQTIYRGGKAVNLRIIPIGAFENEQ